MVYKNININVNDIINGDGDLRSRFNEAVRTARVCSTAENEDPLAKRMETPLRIRKGADTLKKAYLRRMRKYPLI